MEFRRWVACLGVVIFAGCGKPRVSTVPEDRAEPASAEAVSTSAAPPAANLVDDQISPTVAAPVVTNIPAAPRRAPEGVFYLVRKVSVTSDSGVMSVHPGTKVTFVREENGKIIVNNGVTEIPVMQDQLTNDLDEVDAILESAESISRKKAIVARKENLAQPNESGSFSSDSSINDISVSETVNATPSASDAGDLRSRRELAKMQALKDQIDQLEEKIQADQNALTEIESDEEARRDYRMRFGRFPQNAVGIKQSKFEVQQRLAALQRQQRALVLQLSTMGQ
jgi:hypothetical protein